MLNAEEDDGGPVATVVISDDDDERTDQQCDLAAAVEVEGRKPLNHFRWLQLDSSFRFNLAGTDWSPRIEIEALPSGRRFQHTIHAKEDAKSGRTVHDQKLFSLLNSRSQTLISIDLSSDLQSFHVMEPDSDRFIAFFTLPTFPQERGAPSNTIEIHNVVDQEIYLVDSLRVNDLSIPIRSEGGEELAVIMRSPPKWTASQPGLMTLHFSGDDREGLTCRERAVILGFFLAMGIQGMSHWKRSVAGILAVYVLSAILGCFIVFFLYIAYRSDIANSTSGNKLQIGHSEGGYNGLFLPP